MVEEERALRTMAAYIDLNPVRAGMVADLADYVIPGAERTRRSLVFCRKTKFAYREPKCYHSTTMPALVIKSFPEILHTKLRQFATAHRRSVTQETIHLLEAAIAAEEKLSLGTNSGQSKWANRKLLPEYEAMLASGAFRGGTDSTQIISGERDAR